MKRAAAGLSLSSSMASVVSVDLGASWASRSWDNAYFSQSLQERDLRARFQQKQLQEKEQKLLALYESQQQRAFQRVSRSSSLTSNGSSSNNNNNNNNVNNSVSNGGKVRQLLEERRKPQQHSNSAPTGWDRSYPLEPLLRGKPHAHAHAQTQPPQPHRGRARPSWSPPESPPPPACNDSLVFLKLPNVGGPLVTAAPAPEDRFKTYKAGRSNNNNNMASTRQQPALRRTEPRPSPPAVVNSTATTRRVSTPRSTVTSPQQSGPAKASSPVSPVAPATTKAPLAKRTSTPAPAASKARTPLRPVPSGPPRDDLAECRICGRNFANDRIQKHQEICQRTATKKRKVFDPVKQRVKGTEAEQFVKKLTTKGSTPKKQETKKPDWRKKHEEFIATIRAAKEFKAHIAAGGKVTDLPPPPPLDTSDYVQCPHCQRRFNQGAADRHIPRCANMQHNKPKAATKPATARRR